jgi:hypothetical protein
MYKLVLIALIIIIIFYITNYLFKKKYNIHENFTENNVIFIDSNELTEILTNDNDNYYKTFHKNDFISRKIKNIEDYSNLIKLSTSNFTEAEKNKIEKSLLKVNSILKDLKLDWFDGSKANKIQWKIGCVKDKNYEHGLPHTRNDIIIISSEDVNKFSDDKLTKTFIHEKVHVYQKLYPNDIDIYLENNKFIKYKLRDKNDNIRANPDLNNWIYKDNEGNIYKALYNENPSSVEDIQYLPINNQSYEHPFEKMAIQIEDSIKL